MSVKESIQSALALQQAGRSGEAESIYRQILEEYPDDHDALQLLGLLLANQNRDQEAIELLSSAIAAKPGLAIYHNGLGEIYRKMRRWDEAVACYQRALALQPKFAEAYNNLGIAQWFEGRPTEAIASWQRAAQLKPDLAAAHSNLGNALKEQGRLDEAVVAYHQALRAQPGFAEGHLNLGNALQAKGEFEQAKAEFAEAARLRPNLAEAHNNLGNALRELGRLDEAMAAIQRAMELKPGSAEVHNNLGNVLKDQCRLNESIAAFERAIEIDPLLTEPHWNLSHALLLSGDFKRGWEAYEWRWTEKSQFAKRSFVQPQWDGRDLNGQTILIHAEQGLGDSIQFVRYVALVAHRGGKVIVECQPSLVKLFRGSIEAQEIVARGQRLPAFDFHCPMLSLPLAFGTVLNSIPNPGAYLKADPQLAQSWKQKLGDSGDRVRVGIAWAGNPMHVKDRTRSIALPRWAPLAEAKNVIFYSLQKGLTSAPAPPAGMELIDLTAELGDFADTAALVENLDLVVTVDTAIAHLAAAMGKPVWVLIAFSPDWRWMLGRSDSPWYSSLRLFRQPRFGDWDSVIQTVAAELRALTDSRKHGR